jgi:hypothetical protein
MSTTQKPVIRKSDVIAMIENGKTREEIAVHYGIPKGQIAKAFKQLGLVGVKAKKVSFVIEDDTVSDTPEEPIMEDMPTPIMNVEASDIVESII